MIPHRTGQGKVYLTLQLDTSWAPHHIRGPPRKKKKNKGGAKLHSLHRYVY